MKHDTSLPAQPRPVLRAFVVLLSSIFLHYISLIFFQLKFKPSWPLCRFLSHIKIQGKSHIIKRHNRCESIKRERKQKKNPKLLLEFVGECTVHQCFYFTTRWWVHRVPSSIGCVVDLDISKAEVQPDKVYKIYPSSSRFLLRVTKMGEHD